MTKDNFINFIQDLGFEYCSFLESYRLNTDEFGDPNINGYVFIKAIKICIFENFCSVSLSEINKTFMAGEILFRVDFDNFNEQSKLEFINQISKYFKDKNKFKSFLRNDKLNNIL